MTNNFKKELVLQANKKNIKFKSHSDSKVLIVGGGLGCQF